MPRKSGWHGTENQTESCGIEQPGAASLWLNLVAEPFTWSGKGWSSAAAPQSEEGT